MAVVNPAWTAAAIGNALPTQTLAPQTAVGFAVDFRGVMRGRAVLRVTPLGGITYANCGVTCYLASMAGDNAQGDNVWATSYVLAPRMGGANQQSVDLDSGLYFGALYNSDPAYGVSLDVTTEELSWPS